jgi:hypothetical protein
MPSSAPVLIRYWSYFFLLLVIDWLEPVKTQKIKTDCRPAVCGASFILQLNE